jgi:hypothetical protein
MGLMAPGFEPERDGKFDKASFIWLHSTKCDITTSSTSHGMLKVLTAFHTPFS